MEIAVFLLMTKIGFELLDNNNLSEPNIRLDENINLLKYDP